MPPELADFQRFIGHLPGAWWVKDREGRYLYANRATESALGNPRDGVLGKTDFDCLAPESAQMIRQHDQQVLRTGENLEVLETLPSEDSSTRTWYSAKFLVLLGESRCCAGFDTLRDHKIAARIECSARFVGAPDLPTGTGTALVHELDHRRVGLAPEELHQRATSRGFFQRAAVEERNEKVHADGGPARVSVNR